MRDLFLKLSIACLIRLSSVALAVDAWCFDRCYDMGGALINSRRRLPSNLRRRR